ncbi:MAG: hypothetical protein AAF705_05610 [Bacteroidota bacterium]
MNKWISLIIIASFLTSHAYGQCLFDSNFRVATNWTQVGNSVSINNGRVDFVSATGGQQRRVYRELDNPLNASDTWKVELEFTPTDLGNWSGQPAAGHYLFALTQTINEPLNDCPNIACTGYPSSTQDAVMVNFLNPAPPDGSVNFEILHLQAGNELASAKIPFTGLNTTYYLTFERLGPNDYQLAVFSDDERTDHLSGSPVSLNVPGAITGLTTVHHGAIARGNSLRELTGRIDDLCLIANPTTTVVQQDLPAIPGAYLIFMALMVLGVGGILIRK